MIKLHFRVKMRAFRVTFGTVEDTIDVTSVLRQLAIRLVRNDAVGELLTLRDFGGFGKQVLYDDRGVYIALVGE